MASLAEALYALPTERLRALAQTQKVDPKKLSMAANKRQLVQALANDLSKPPSIAAAIAQCNQRMLRLLQLLLSGDSNSVVSWSQLIEAAGAGGPELSDALQTVVARLEDFGLAFRLGDGVYLSEAARPYIPASLPDRFTLVKCLQSYDAPTMKRLCDRLDLHPETDTKAVRMEAIRAHLLDAGAVERLKCSLEPQEFAVLEYIVQAGGAASAPDVASSVLGGRIDEFFRYDWQNRWKQGRERNAVDRLLGRGMLYVVSHSYAYNLFLVIPGDLLRVLTGSADAAFWTGPPAAPRPLPMSPPVVSRHSRLSRDVVGLLAFLSQQEAVRTSTGHIHKTSLKNLARTLSLPEERYAAFLYATCREAGLIAPTGEKQVYALTSKGNSWLHWDPMTQARVLMEAWRDGLSWAEMYSDPLSKAGDYRPLADILEIRSAVLAIVTENVGETFIEIGSLTDTLAFRFPLLLVQSMQNRSDLVPSPTTFLRLLVGECLTWLGLVELGLAGQPPSPGEPVAPSTGKARTAMGRAARAIGAQARAAISSVAGTIGGTAGGESTPTTNASDILGYRLTPLGAFLLGVPDVPMPTAEPQEDKFIVQANAEIFLPPFLELATLYHLLLMTDPPAKGAAGNTVVLTREAIRRALDQGETFRELLSFLQAHARTGIPQNIEYLINEVAGKHGHIHIGRAQIYLQVDSPLLLKELAARKEFKPYFVRTLGDTVALLKAEDPDKVLRELRKAGYLPISDDAPRLPAFRADGRIAPPSTKPPVSAQEKQARRVAKTDTALDWMRIAQDDGKPWNTVGNTSAPKTDVSNLSTERPSVDPNGAVKSPALITLLLRQAVNSRRCVEIVTLGEHPEPRIIEPRGVTGHFVNAYCRLTQQHDTFNIERIQWARLTAEIFKR